MKFVLGKKKIKKQILLLKVDFDKAFDAVNLEYLYLILLQMGYQPKWCMWIKGSLQLARASILINGSPTNEFTMGRGVRQGDPLLPFLFIIAMEGLNIAIKTTRDKSLFKGIKIPHENTTLAHLFYADNALFVGSGV